jgi:4-amino-4-deoxy-L-arabinose transferase-like glycosyltransferase
MSRVVYLVQPLNRSRPISNMGITPPLTCAPTADSAQTSFIRRAAALGCVALAVFASGVFDKSFEDEYAYINQSFYTDLFFDGDLNDALWLDRLAYDLQPLPKYLIGMALEAANLKMPRPADASKWYDDYHAFGRRSTLTVARIPFLPLGAIGCAAIFACGALVKDRRAGTMAALFLMADPVYRLHAHRAMSDVPCEAFTVVSLGFYLWFCRRIWLGRGVLAAVVLPALAGVFAGLSLLCKFTGFLGLIVVTAWSAGAWLLPGLSLPRKTGLAAAALATIAVALALAVVLNPFLTARPAPPLANPESRELVNQSIAQRFVFQVEHRARTSDAQRENMSHNALYTLPEKAEVFLVQGFGRFSPFGPSKSDSTIRSDPRQDWGLILWAPLVFYGVFEAFRLGRAQLQTGQPPAALTLLVWALLSWLVVVTYLPMAWDRYLLPIQSANMLLAALAVSALWDRLSRRFRGAGARA